MQRRNLNCISCVVALAGLFVLPASCLAQKALKAKFSVDGIANCEKPAVRDFPIHTEGTGTLAVDRHASLDMSSFAGGRVHYEATLGGKPTETAGGDASLRVMGRHHLRAVRTYPNNILVADITVRGNSCSLTVENRLKPGKRQYTFTGRFGFVAYCDRPRIVRTSCEPIL
jgi:hypothetical protein